MDVGYIRHPQLIDAADHALCDEIWINPKIVIAGAEITETLSNAKILDIISRFFEFLYSYKR